MSDPSPEVVAAALALAEATHAWSDKMGAFTGRHEGRITDEEREWNAVGSALDAYRAAIAPKLRTRAEWLVEVEQFLRVLSPEMLRSAGYEDLARLAVEQTAPEPDPVCDECGAVHGPGNTNTCCPRASNYRGPHPDDACGCEASDALRERLARVEALVNLWTLQVADYPKTTEGEYGAAGVRCCIRELKEALEP